MSFTDLHPFGPVVFNDCLQVLRLLGAVVIVIVHVLQALDPPHNVRLQIFGFFGVDAIGVSTWAVNDGNGDAYGRPGGVVFSIKSNAS